MPCGLRASAASALASCAAADCSWATSCSSSPAAAATFASFLFRPSATLA